MFGRTPILVSPYYYSASIVAKLSTIAATVIWCAVVLVHGTALSPARFPFYYSMLELAGEDVWAGALVAVCTACFVRLVTHAKPMWAGGIAYFLLMVFWLYLEVGFVVSVLGPAVAQTRSPGLLGTTTVVAALAVYAFVANPKRPCN